MRITNPPAGHDSLDGVSTSDHHTKYSDSDARGAVVEDAAYGVGWNADATHAPSQNAVYDKIEAIAHAVYTDAEARAAAVEDAAYGSGWNADTTHAPSQNAVYDKIEAIIEGHGDVGCKVTHSSTQSASANSWNVLTFTATDLWDTDSIHDTSTNPSRLTCTVAGKYLVFGSLSTAYQAAVSWTSPSALRVMEGGSTLIGYGSLANGNGTGISSAGWGIAVVADLDVDDYVELNFKPVSWTQTVESGVVFGMQLLG